MDNDEPSLEQPVAYDAEGKPLYAHPQVSDGTAPHSSQPAPAVVHISRPFEPQAVEPSPELQGKHRQSAEAFPQLDLSDNEYVILNVRRHIIGLLIPFIVAIIAICFIIAATLLASDLMNFTGWQFNLALAHLTGWVAVVFLSLGLYVYYWVYSNNILFLTNESIIEKTQMSLFVSNVKSVGLSDVVDISFQKIGLIEQLFDFGTIKIGTKYNKDPFVFRFVQRPRLQAAVLIDAVECFKNGRPIIESQSLKQFLARR